MSIVTVSVVVMLALLGSLVAVLGAPLLVLLPVLLVLLAIVWLVGVALSRRSVGATLAEPDPPELLGPGGPDDPDRDRRP